jgi:hypothetical protein
MSLISMNERQPQSKLQQPRRWVEVSFPVPINAVSWDAGRPRRLRPLSSRGRFRCLRALRLGSGNAIAAVASFTQARTHQKPLR